MIAEVSSTIEAGNAQCAERASPAVLCLAHTLSYRGPISYPAELSTAGAGDDVFLYNGEATTMSFAHDGTGNFIAVEYMGRGRGSGPFVAETGAYSGTVPISGGPLVIRVNSDD